MHVYRRLRSFETWSASSMRSGRHHFSCLVGIMLRPTDCRKPTGLRPHLRPDSKPTRVPTSATGRLMRTDRLPTVGLMSAVRVPTSVPTGADRHLKVPTCADRDRRGRRLRGAIPPVPRGFVGTKFAVQGYSEAFLIKFIDFIF
jgi:hypothetical protein